MAEDDILAKIKALQPQDAQTGEQIRIKQIIEANAKLVEPVPSPRVEVAPDRPSTHVKEQFGGNLSDIPVGHQYWNGRYRKPR